MTDPFSCARVARERGNATPPRSRPTVRDQALFLTASHQPLFHFELYRGGRELGTLAHIHRFSVYWGSRHAQNCPASYCFSCLTLPLAAQARVRITVDLSSQQMDVDRHPTAHPIPGPFPRLAPVMSRRAASIRRSACRLCISRKSIIIRRCRIRFSSVAATPFTALMQPPRSVIPPRMAASAFRRPTRPRCFHWSAPRARRSQSSVRRLPAALRQRAIEPPRALRQLPSGAHPSALSYAPDHRTSDVGRMLRKHRGYSTGSDGTIWRETMLLTASKRSLSPMISKLSATVTVLNTYDRGGADQQAIEQPKNAAGDECDLRDQRNRSGVAAAQDFDRLWSPAQRRERAGGKADDFRIEVHPPFPSAGRIALVLYSAEQPRHDPRGIIDHWHDARVIEPRRPDHPEHADDPPLQIMERRGDH